MTEEVIKSKIKDLELVKNSGGGGGPEEEKKKQTDKLKKAFKQDKILIKIKLRGDTEKEYKLVYDETNNLIKDADGTTVV